MIFVTHAKLREHVDMSKLTDGLLMEAFSYLAEGDRNHFLFTNTDEYETMCAEYITTQGWDPDTTLVLSDWPATAEEKAAQEAATAKAIAEDPDWDDIQIGHVDPKQIICSFYPNTTLEKMADTINTFVNLKAFL